MTVIRYVEARRDEGKKAVSVMCVIVYVDTSFHPALSRWKKDHNLENENSFFLLSPSRPLTTERGGGLPQW